MRNSCEVSGLGIPELDLDSPDLAKDMQAPPEILYHYTTPAGFKGIVESGGRLWASHWRFSNDLLEGSVGVELASEVVTAVGQQGTLGLARELAKRNVFIACMSERYDILSQWRAYAANAHGYCVGLKIHQRMSAWAEETSSTLLKCSYDRELDRKELIERIDRKLQMAEGQSSEVVARYLAPVLERYSLVAKHEHFEEEEEWRLVVESPESEREYRITTLGVTPYVMTEPLELKEVWVGSPLARSADVARLVTEGYLRKHGHRAKVAVWETSLR